MSPTGAHAETEKQILRTVRRRPATGLGM